MTGSDSLTFRSNMTVLESNLRALLRETARFPSGTVTFCEFAKGGDPGMPDCWIAGNLCLITGKRHWLPTELKRGPSVLKALRPSQRLWHRTSIELGIRTFGMTISYSGESIDVFELGLSNGNLFESMIGQMQPVNLTLSHFLGIVDD